MITGCHEAQGTRHNGNRRTINAVTKGLNMGLCDLPYRKKHNRRGWHWRCKIAGSIGRMLFHVKERGNSCSIQNLPGRVYSSV